MQSGEKGLFLNTVLNKFIEIQKQLAGELEDTAIKGALKELTEALEPVARRHFGEVQHRHKYVVGPYFPMLQRMVLQWYRQFMRRMTAKCKVRSPWKVLMDVKISIELFTIIRDLVLETNYGVYYDETKSKPKKCVMAFTSLARVKTLFTQLMDTSVHPDEFLCKKVKKTSRIEVIVNEEKQFGLLYNYGKELLSFDFHYGLWNEHGFPQHL